MVLEVEKSYTELITWGTGLFTTALLILLVHPYWYVSQCGGCSVGLFSVCLYFICLTERISAYLSHFG